MDNAIQQTAPRSWVLDYGCGVAAQEAGRQSITLIEALVARDQDDPLTRALLPRLFDLANVIVAAFDNEESEDELLRRVWGVWDPKPAIPD